MPADIRKTSKAPGVNIMKQGHTTNGSFGSDPAKKVKGSRPTRDISAPGSSR